MRPYLFFLMLFYFTHTSGQVVFDTAINTGIESEQLYENLGAMRLFMFGNQSVLNIYSISSKEISQKDIDQWQKIYVKPAEGEWGVDSFMLPDEMRGYTLRSAVVQGEYLFFIAGNTIYVYKHAAGRFDMFKTIESKFSFNNIAVLNDSTLLFSVTYRFHPRDQVEKSVVSLFDINTLDFTKTIFPGIHGIEYSYFVPTWVNAYKGKVAVVKDPMNYTIDILDDKLNKLTTIHPLCKDWVTISDDTLAYISEVTGKDALFRAQHFDRNISRVLSVIFLDDTHILVLYKLRGVNGDKYYDIIELRGDQFTMLSSKNLIKQSYDDDTDLLKNCNLAFMPVINSYAVILPLAGRQFLLPCINYFPINGNTGVVGYFAEAAKKRHDKNKTLALLKFTW